MIFEAMKVKFFLYPIYPSFKIKYWVKQKINKNTKPFIDNIQIIKNTYRSIFEPEVKIVCKLFVFVIYLTNIIFIKNEI